MFRVTRLCGSIVAKALEDPETEALLQRASGGGPALDVLLERHRNRLRRMVAVRLDSRLAPLVDPSDVVQEALADASRKLDDFLRDRPFPFCPWLRRLAWERTRSDQSWSARKEARAPTEGVCGFFTCCPSQAQTIPRTATTASL